MDDLSKFVLEISSDEDFGNLMTEGDGLSAGSEVYDRDDHEWLQTLLGEVDGNNGDAGLLGDGVLDKDVVVPETVENLSLQSPNPVPEDVKPVPEAVKPVPEDMKPIPEAVKPIPEDVKPAPEIVNLDSDDSNDSDDDCMILDGDPDKPVLVDKVEANCGGGNDSDDLQIVAEKGEVACRDFPHSRHLCAKFTFASTSHVDHCGQCHCYVCDTLAPCVYWGTGTSSIDHCHASDKEDYWRTERKKSKKGDKPAPITIKSFLSRNHQTTPVAPPPPTTLVPHQAAMPATTPPCSVVSDVSVPNSIDKYRLLRRSQSMSTKMLRTACNRHVSSMDMNQNMAKRAYPFPPPQAEFNMNGYACASPNAMHVFNNSSSQSQSSHEPALKRCRTLPTCVPNGSYGSNQYNNGSCVPPMPTHMNSPAPPTMNVRSTYIPSQPQIPSGASYPIKPSQLQTCPGPVSSYPIRSSQPQIRPCPVLIRPIRPNPQIPTGSIPSSQIRPNAQIRPGPILSNQRPSQPQIRPGSITNGMGRPSQAQIQPGPISSSPIRGTINPRIPFHSQPYPGSNFGDAVTAHSQATSQLCAASFRNVIGSQTGSAFQPNCSLPSTPPNLSSTSGNQPHPKSTTSSYPGISNTSQNQSSSHSSLSADGQNACQQVTEGNLFTNPDLEAEWEAFLNENCPQAPSDTSLLQSAVPADNNPSLSVQKDDRVQNIAPADNFLEKSAMSPDNSTSLSLPECFQFESSMYNDQLSDLVVPESPLWNEF